MNLLRCEFSEGYLIDKNLMLDDCIKAFSFSKPFSSLKSLNYELYTFIPHTFGTSINFINFLFLPFLRVLKRTEKIWKDFFFIFERTSCLLTIYRFLIYVHTYILCILHIYISCIVHIYILLYVKWSVRY